MAKGIKTGGRRKGTPNKISGTVKEMVNQAISKELESLPKLLNELEPKEKIEAIIKLLPYLLPKVTPEIKTEKSPKERHESLIQQFIKQMNINKAIS